jgi:methyl-accepting chemotaxis protein
MAADAARGSALAGLKIWQKFALVSLAFAVPAAVLLYALTPGDAPARQFAPPFAAVTFALALLLVLVVARGLTRQVRSLTGMFEQISVGNFQARAEVLGRDELGEMAAALNAMLDHTLGLVQSREERDRIQASIQKLLEEISGVAEGDLTKEAEVTADVTGSIADAFNNMIDQLRKVISNVQEATLQVSTSANQIQATADTLVNGSESQALQIGKTSAAVDEMAGSIQQVSENAVQSARVAELALANARQGAEAVQNTIEGMNRIRDQVQETAKRIKRLGESSQQIGEIVQLIDDIADRTSILALNASIQAAMAGEAGRGFAVVAEEVERLAERSTNATKKIANLIKTIQSETNEAVTAMEEGTREVVEGSKLANQAGQALGEIENVSNRLASLIQSISQASRQQARASEGVVKSMNEISEVTQQTATGTKQAATAVSALAGLADELRGSVSTFRLPGRNGHAEDGPRSANRLAAVNGGNGHKAARAKR